MHLDKPMLHAAYLPTIQLHTTTKHKTQVGVVGRDGVYRVLDKGRLAPAVVASAAIPLLFANVDVDGRERMCVCVA